MYKFYVNIIFLLLFITSPAISQSLEGLRDIVSAQQEKILTLEDNLKKLIGSIEQQSNVSNNNKFIKLFQNELNDLSNKIKLLENSIKNITNLSDNLDFARKRIERHLEVRSIQNNSKNQTNNLESKLEPNYTKEKIEHVQKSNLV